MRSDSHDCVKTKRDFESENLCEKVVNNLPTRSDASMAQTEFIAILLHLLFIVVVISGGNESLHSRNSDGAVMITNQWQINDCMTRNCLHGNYYKTTSENVTSVINKNHQIHLAVLLPSRPVDEMSERSTQILATTLPVIELAIRAVKEKRILDGYELIIHHRDTQCSSTFGPMAAFDLYNRQEADVFLGPICDYVLAPVARYASVWRRPVLTTGGLAAAFNNKVKGFAVCFSFFKANHHSLSLAEFTVFDATRHLKIEENVKSFSR